MTNNTNDQNGKPGEQPRQHKRRFSAEFKAEALRLLRQRHAQGVTAADVARELGVGPGLLSMWAQQARATDARGDRSETLEEEVRRLRRENAILREERAFAKKAAAFFAMESR
jgi:transposase